MNDKKIIAVDFDGTCVSHEFPAIGKEIGATDVLRKLVAKGHRLILFTMRSNSPSTDFEDDPSNYLSDAVRWFTKKGIPLYGINKNPSQHTWTSSPKPYAHIYIDDAALGVPLIHDPSVSSRPFVDWVKVEQHLKDLGVL